MNLYLIGPRGSGKSTVAQLVARRLDVPCLSSDEWIQAESGLTIAKMFAEQGESKFREWELKAVQVAVRSPKSVVDLGGGAILNAEIRRLLRESGFAVWLFASAETLWQRVNADPRSATTRPPLTQADGLDEMQQVLADRETLYAACADYEIDTGGIPPDEVARRVLAWYQSADKQKRDCSELA